MSARELQISQREKQEILAFEGHLAAASTKQTITESSSLLLSQLTSLDPQCVRGRSLGRGLLAWRGGVPGAQPLGRRRPAQALSQVSGAECPAAVQVAGGRGALRWAQAAPTPTSAVGARVWL